MDNLEEGDWNERIPNELPVDTAWEDVYQTSASSLPSNDDDEWDFTTRTSAGESLQSHLLWQLNLAPMSDTDRLIAVTLIDCINNQGYLDETLEEILEAFDPELDVELDEIEAVLHRIQQFEPAGIGARNLSECLLLQLRQMPAKTLWLTEAKRLVTDFIDLLGSRDYSQLMRRMKLKEDELRQIIELVQSLNPRPGSQIPPRHPLASNAARLRSSSASRLLSPHRHPTPHTAPAPVHKRLPSRHLKPRTQPLQAPPPRRHPEVLRKI